MIKTYKQRYNCKYNDPCPQFIIEIIEVHNRQPVNHSKIVQGKKYNPACCASFLLPQVAVVHHSVSIALSFKTICGRKHVFLMILIYCLIDSALMYTYMVPASMQHLASMIIL